MLHVKVQHGALCRHSRLVDARSIILTTTAHHHTAQASTKHASAQEREHASARAAHLGERRVAQLLHRLEREPLALVAVDKRAVAHDVVVVVAVPRLDHLLGGARLVDVERRGGGPVRALDVAHAPERRRLYPVFLVLHAARRSTSVSNCNVLTLLSCTSIALCVA